VLNRLTSRGRRTLNKPVGCDIVEGDALSADNSLLLQQVEIACKRQNALGDLEDRAAEVVDW
jgi:hypothetical protein